MGIYYELINLTAKVCFPRGKHCWKGCPPSVREVFHIATSLGWDIENDLIATFGEEHPGAFFLFQGKWVPFPDDVDNDVDDEEDSPEYRAYQARMKEQREQTRQGDILYQRSRLFVRDFELKEFRWNGETATAIDKKVEQVEQVKQVEPEVLEETSD
jgi:hypothetical protein